MPVLDDLFNAGKGFVTDDVFHAARVFGGGFLTDADVHEETGQHDMPLIDFGGNPGALFRQLDDLVVVDGNVPAVFEKAKKGLSFGACTEAEVELAELIVENIPHVDMIRMVNSGTEAVMSAK